MSLGLSEEDIERLKENSGLSAGTDVSWQQFLTMLPELLKRQLEQCATSDADWCELQAESGATYYYNKRTEESSWTKPASSLPTDMQAYIESICEAADKDQSGRKATLYICFID